MAAIMPGCRSLQVTRPGRLLEPHRAKDYDRVKRRGLCYDLGTQQIVKANDTAANTSADTGTTTAATDTTTPATTTTTAPVTGG